MILERVCALLLTLFLLESCYRAPHVLPQHAFSCQANESDYFLVILVDARQLDYSNCRSLLKTVAKHPSDGSKTGDVGHAWIYLQGVIDGECVYVEGGHSGECSSSEAKYFDGIMNYIDYGYANPTCRQMECPRYEPNPIKYLWATRRDGFFQWGSGRHHPTYAARVNLTPEQFQRIMDFIENYPYAYYALTGNQCSSFVTQIANLAKLDLDCEVTIAFDPSITLGGCSLHLWEDPAYAHLTIATPDVLERSLMHAVENGQAEDALDWYGSRRKECLACRAACFWETMVHFPYRFSRYLYVK